MAINLNNPLSDNDLNLAGNRTNYLEDQFNPKERLIPDPLTGSLLIIGSATDGPVGEPVSVREIGGVKAAVEMFGGLTEKIQYEEYGRKRYVEIPNNNKLTRAIMEAANSGNDDIRIFRVDGRHAMTELLVDDPNSEITQPLADNTGSNLMNGNIRFMVDIQMAKGERFLNITKIEELTPEGTIVSVKNGKEGYLEIIDGFNNNVEVHVDKDMYYPGNTLKVYYKVSNRDYITVDYMSADGLLTHDPSNNRYFASSFENWSDDPTHTINLYLVEKGGNPDGSDKAHAIPSMIDGKYIYRPGSGDPEVTDEMTTYPTNEEFRQGGIRFTSEYDKHVASGLYPSLSKTNLVAQADYTRYDSTIVDETQEETIKGQQKGRALRTTPDLDTLEVYYEHDGDKKVLEIDTDFSLLLGLNSSEKDYITIKSGAAPIGSKLYAKYRGLGATDESGVITIKSIYPGATYGSFKEQDDLDSYRGVTITVEYPVKSDGSADLEGRIVRIKKPANKMRASIDTELVYDSKKLTQVKTLNSLVNFINNDPTNNVVRLEISSSIRNLLFNSLNVTNNTQNPSTGEFLYEAVRLGDKFNSNTGKHELYQDENFDIGDERRFPWMGTNGEYDNTDLLSMKKYYEKLGGVYGWDYDRSVENQVLLEPGVFTDLENYPVEQVLLIDVYANTAIGKVDDYGEVELDTEKSFATQLAQFCATLSARTDYSTGIIHMAPLASTKLRDVQEAIDLFAGIRVPTEEIKEKYMARGVNPYFKNNHFLYNPMTGEEIFNDKAQPIDIGFFLTNIFGPEVSLAEERIGTYLTPSTVPLAALISTLPANVSTTNHTINVLGLRYSLSSPQHSQLVGAGYVALDTERTLRGRQRFVVKDGITSGQPESDYKLLSTIRITNLAVHAVRMATQPYIGKAGGLAQDNSISADVKASLDKLKEQGMLIDFRFSVDVTGEGDMVKNVFIDLEIVPVFEVRRIRTTVSVTGSL